MKEQDLFPSVASQKTYIPLARKYRPKLFKDVVEQRHIVKIITNSINSKKLHHSYLLTGIRGVGKTSFARIISKAINCTSPDGVEPCLECKSCISIEEGRNQDILEIDAASNTGVNDIREVIENARYMPVQAAYKIYIIDEVHMLSNSAFNALLKTLEEPPLHCKFILATTEQRKVPKTILSRCQKLDLHRFHSSELLQYLHDIATKEGYSVDQEVLRIITKTAQGSARDALSLLEQALLSVSSYQVSYSDVVEMFGIVDSQEIYQLFYYILLGSVKEALSLCDLLYGKGFEIRAILSQLGEIIHKISMLTLGDMDNIFSSDFEKQECLKFSEHISSFGLSRFWTVLNNTLSKISRSLNELYELHMLVIKLCHLNIDVTPEEILKTSIAEPTSALEVKKKSLNTSR